jgi:hypothetical protein
MTEAHCFRLKPGQDLKRELIAYCNSHSINAAAILSGVGSLATANMRLADGKEGRIFQGPFEIVSLTGTLNHTTAHLHISIADSEGHVLGGHLMEGGPIHTTAEIVLLELSGFNFSREMDPETGYKELKIHHTK